jgi:hypothetical protein
LFVLHAEEINTAQAELFTPRAHRSCHAMAAAFAVVGLACMPPGKPASQPLREAQSTKKAVHTRAFLSRTGEG